MASRFWGPDRTAKGKKTRTRDDREESFKPIWEWKKEEKFLVLVVYLPGFTKEHLHVSTHGINMLSMRGWRLISGGRQESFQEEFELPKECSMAGIRAKFEGGILTITIPKKTAAATTVSPPRDTTPKRHQEGDGNDRFRATPMRGGAPTTPHSKPKQYQEEDGGDKGSATPRRDDASTVKQEVVKPKQTDISKSSEATKKRPEKQAADSMRDITASAGQAGKITVERKKRAEGGGQPTESKFDEKGQENSIAKPRSEENMVPEKEDKAKEAREATASSRREKGKKDLITSPRNEQNMVTKKEVKATKGELKEETQLMVNMGVAVLVIVALAAYISFTSSGKPKN